MKPVLTPDSTRIHLEAFPPAPRERLARALHGETFAGRVDADVVGEILRLDPAGLATQDLMLRLLPLAQSFAQAGFKVGAISQGAGGALYLGANLEIKGAPLGFTLHAEQSAILGALAGGETAVRRLAVTAPPCGHCRQFLNEVNGSSDLEIILPGRTPVTLPQLLPEAFGPWNLGVEAALLARGVTRLREVRRSPPDPLGRAALEAAGRSYAPYTCSLSSVALETEDGTMAAAPYVENAAYNPSVAPMVAALDRLRFRDRNASTIRRAVLVEMEDASIAQAPASRVMLEAVGSAAPLTVLLVQLAGRP